MTDKLISDLGAIGAAIADNTAFEAQRNGQTTTEQALGSDLYTYMKSKITKTDVGLSNVTNNLQLTAANNLSDVADADAARSNLSVGFGMDRNRFYTFNDCIASSAAFPSDHWSITTNGGAASTASNIAPGALNAIGVLSLDLGTTTTGRVAMASFSSSPGVTMKLGSGRARFNAKCAIHVLSTGTDTYTTRVGFIDTLTGESTDAVMFRYTDGVNSGKWQAVCRSNGVETTADTGIVPVADTWHLMSIDVNAAGSSVVFSIDGSTVATITTNIPTGAGRELGYGAASTKSAGTTATSGGYFDFMEVDVQFTSQR